MWVILHNVFPWNGDFLWGHGQKMADTMSSSGAAELTTPKYSKM